MIFLLIICKLFGTNVRVVGLGLYDGLKTHKLARLDGFFNEPSSHFSVSLMSWLESCSQANRVRGAKGLGLRCTVHLKF